MQVEPAPFGPLEVEGESIELSATSQPDKTVVSNLNVGSKDLLILPPRHRGDAVGGDDQVVACGVIVRICDFGLEDQLYSQVGGPALQDFQQLDTGNTAETVSTGGNLPVFEKD